MIRGTTKIDGLALGELRVSFLGEGLEIYGKAAFVDSTTGNTHGWTEGRGQLWSKNTLAKLAELRLCMEMDLGAVHLKNMEDGDTGTAAAEDDEGGLVEHLGTGDAPSI